MKTKNELINDYKNGMLKDISKCATPYCSDIVLTDYRLDDTVFGYEDILRPNGKRNKRFFMHKVYKNERHKEEYIILDSQSYLLNKFINL